ncbi:MAG: adenylate/guanylate cyclase domain-containing protein [Chloroflexota bacterium]
MSLSPSRQVAQIKQALAEIRANREHFTEASFSQIVMLMLDKLRRVQTVTPEETPTTDEVRLVTVMFIDVKDSTEIVQKIDASDWKLIIDTAHEQIADIISQWDGQVGQYLGDGVLCFFGAQRSRGDDAPHAVACALQIQSAVESYAKKVQSSHGIEFSIRIGISTGRVVVGLIGSQTVKQELLALGPATNLAARLQGVAPVGGVLIDSATYQRIRRDYITQAQTPVDLRGFDKPINNYVVLGRRTQPANQFTPTQIAGIEIPLVGRDEDLALISYLCDRALQRKRTEVITLTGDVGMGKSRILQETIHLTEGHFNHIVMTSQYESRTKSQNLLWDMLTTQCHLTHTMSASESLQQIEAYITELWEHDDAIHAAHAIAFAAGFSNKRPQGDVTEWILRWFEGIAQQTPIVLVVDNLQWADASSIELLQKIAKRLNGLSCVIIVATRPEYETIYPNFMESHPNHTTIPLEELKADATLSIIQNILAKVDRVPSHLAYSINERVEGNPLFVYEYISMLFDYNVFKHLSDGSWRFNVIMLDVALNTLPNGLLNILQARLDDLPDSARILMQLSAISGQRFWVAALDTLSDIDNIEGWIDHLVMRGMVVADKTSIFDGEEQYHFKHSLYRDVAYEMLPRAKRESYHKAMAWWLLERIYGQEEYYPLLADQFASSGDYLASLYAYLEAVEVQINKRQELNALVHIDRALSLASRLDRGDALAVVAKLWAYRAKALVTLERYEEASAASQSALMLLNELPNDQLIDSRITAERILGLAYLSLGRYPDAYDALTRAHNLLPEKATSQIATVLIALGTMYYCRGRLDDSYAYLRRAFTMANKTQELERIAESIVCLSLVDIETGNVADTLDILEQALQIYRSLDLVAEQASTLAQLGLLHLSMLDYGKAYEYFSDSDYLNTTAGYTNYLVQGRRGLSLIMLGRVTQGKGLLADAMDNLPQDTNTRHRLQLTSIIGATILGDYAKARDQALALVQQDNINPIIKARAEIFLGVASHELGTSDAMSYLQLAIEGERTYGGRDLWLCHMTFAQYCEDEDEKADHYQKSLQLIKDRITDLEKMPDMREQFIGNRYVQAVLKMVGVDAESLTT